MTITPDDVRNQVFRVALRGYAVEEVDAFLDRLESALRTRTDAPADGDHSIEAAPVRDGSGSPAPTADAPAQGVRLLRLAESTAEQLLEEARAEAAACVEAARAAAARVTAEAEAEVDRLQRQTQVQREQLVAMLTQQLQAVQAGRLLAVA